MAKIEFVSIYDDVYHSRDTVTDVETCLDLFARTNTEPSTLLDIGCGTGRHVSGFADNGIAVTGVDLDERAIEIARNRHDGLAVPPTFVAGSVEMVTQRDFDAACALFHVVNYVTDHRSLGDLFAAIRDRVRPKAPFVFDMWNGVAAILDPPRRKTETISTPDGRSITVVTEPETDLLQQEVTLHVTGFVRHEDGRTDDFEHTYLHRLWTPSEVVGVASTYGFETKSCHPSGNPARTAGESDWKIVFLLTATE